MSPIIFTAVFFVTVVTHIAISMQGVSSSTETNDMCVGTGASLILSEDISTEITQHQVNNQSAQCTWSRDIGSEAEPSEADSTSFYLRFKENEDPSNGWQHSSSS